MSSASRLGAAFLLVGVGFLLSPSAVPVYDGIGAPDEPYRYVERPAGAPVTAAPTEAKAVSPVVAGRSSYGLNVSTAEVGPQLALFVPLQALAVEGPAKTVQVRAVPQVPASDPPPGTHSDGNSYLVTLSAAGSAVTLTEKAEFATLLLRATTAAQPPPVLQYRAQPTDPWRALETTRAGMDIYGARWPGPGQFQLVFALRPEGKGSSPLPFVVLGVVTLLAASVVTLRLRSSR